MTYRRRVQVTGGGTFLVTLPKDWADTAGITQGSVVELVPNRSGALLLLPPAARGRNTCEIPLEGRDAVALQRDVIARYVAGYDVIRVTGHRVRLEGRRVVREIAQGLIGLEILEESQTAVALHSVVSMKDFPVGQTLHRVFEIALGMFDDALTSWCTQDDELAHDVAERDSDVDRLVLLVARQLGLLLRDLLVEEEIGLSRLHCHYHLEVADQLERVADHAVKVSRAALAIVESPVADVAREVAAAAGESRSVLSSAVRAFEARDVELANVALASKTEHLKIAQWAPTAIRKQPKNAFPISIVSDSVVRTREHGFNIAETAIDAAVALRGDGDGEDRSPD